MNRQCLRKSKIQARDNLSVGKRRELSQKIVERILASQEFRTAKTVMIYKGIRGEVRLEALEEAVRQQNLVAAKQQNLMATKQQQMIALKRETQQASCMVEEKRLVYPYCISKSEMIALLPEDEEAWQTGRFGIQEPIWERSVEIAPEDIDMVICPCTAFDEQGHRMGMGGGYYDRYLEKCTHAVIAAVAFECQKADHVPMEAWDKSMDMIFTEDMTYRKSHL